MTAPAASSSATDEYEILIRGSNGSELKFSVVDRALYNHTMRWSYILGNRRRIAEAAWKTLADQALSDLQSIGVIDVRERIEQLAGGDVVEVRIPFTTESTGWAARTFPWEAVIALLTKPHRVDRPIQVVRHLDCAGRGGQKPTPPKKLLLVQSDPGKLGDLFSFDTECEMVRNVLGFSTGGDDLLLKPTLEKLTERVQHDKPGVIHLAGVDIHQAQELVAGFENPEGMDGFVLCGPTSSYYHAKPEPMARAVTAAQSPPVLVSYNCYHSAARLAALAVAKGARLAIGFQDRVNDNAAEQFFACFYEAWRESGWDALAGFKKGREEAGDALGGRHGGGVVLWSDHSLLPASPTAGALSVQPVPTAAMPWEQSGLPLSELLTADVDPYPELNYSMLHNGQALFRSFVLKKKRNLKLPPANVEVVLHAGGYDFPFRTQVPELGMVTPMLDRYKVSVPLVADVLRECRESLRSSLFVEVTCGNSLVYRHTHSVTLLSADEWRDDALNQRWLPSFVLPRDPAVKKIIGLAERYLQAIADDPQAGFDGYQRLVSSVDANGVETCEDPEGAVDAQVQALWNALLHDLALSYINPPPTYTGLSQRLRTPSQVLEGRRGTCIDLALLFAACLEYVGIFPVVFLIKGHAFPGYWRSDCAWDSLFNEFRDAPPPASRGMPLATSSGVEDRSASAQGQTASWMLDGAEVLQAMWREVQAGNIAPFESTLVTQRGSFQKALADGAGNLAADSFEALVDINRARNPQDGVLPLPILPERL